MPGAGSTEFLLSKRILKIADVSPGLDQYSIRAFCKALEIVPRTLAETAGLDAPKMVADLNSSTLERPGVDLEAGGVGNATVLDLLNSKTTAFRLAIDAALTVLRVDQIIMSKQAGGPK